MSIPTIKDSLIAELQQAKNTYALAVAAHAEAARNYRGNHPGLEEARDCLAVAFYRLEAAQNNAAYAEVVEAANTIVAFNSGDEHVSVRTADIAALRAALARAGGAA